MGAEMVNSREKRWPAKAGEVRGNRTTFGEGGVPGTASGELASERADLNPSSGCTQHFAHDPRLSGPSPEPRMGGGEPASPFRVCCQKGFVFCFCCCFWFGYFVFQGEKVCNYFI